MTLNYIERMTRYNDLKRDYDLQCIENNKKQEQIIELKKRIKELEALSDNTGKQTRSKRTGRQAKKI